TNLHYTKSQVNPYSTRQHLNATCHINLKNSRSFSRYCDPSAGVRACVACVCVCVCVCVCGCGGIERGSVSSDPPKLLHLKEFIKNTVACSVLSVSYVAVNTD